MLLYASRKTKATGCARSSLARSLRLAGCARAQLFLLSRLSLAELSAVSDDDLLGGGAVLGSDLLDGLDDVEALGDPSEHDVGSVEPRGLNSADEELRPVGVLAGVGRGKDACAGVSFLEVLVLELHAVDGLSSGAVVVGEVATLAHELWDHAVEGAPLVVQGLAALADALP